MDVLFLSVSAGGGHLKAAEAIKEKIEQVYPGSRTMIVDVFRHLNPVVDKLIIGSYLSTLKKTPNIYGKLYEISEAGDNISDLSNTVNKLLSFKIKKLINEFAPSIIVCTHPFPLQMVATLKSRGKISTPSVAVVTDYVAHPLWFHNCADAYVVAHQHIKYDMIERGVPEEIIYPYGIPVCSDFLYRRNRKDLLTEFGLQDKLTALIMGGSLGFGEIKNTFLSMLNSKKDLQIIVITGKNVKLKRQLEIYAQHKDKKVVLLSYTTRIPDLMDVADFIITKPGGMTVSEALVKELPMFIISPIPGQEERNALFLVNNGAAARIMDNGRTDSILSQIIDNPLRVRHMKEMSRYLARPNAAMDITGLLGRMTQNSKLFVSS